VPWITSKRAAEISSEIHKREIQPGYIRLLADNDHIRSKIDPEDESRRLFWEEDVREYHIRRRTDRRVEVRVRDQRSGKPAGRPRKKKEQG